MEKIDLKKRYKALYSAKPEIGEVDAGEGRFLVVESQGSPGGEAFQKAVEQLYSVAYTLKFTLKNAGTLDFGICSLEALYFDDPADTPRDEWRWHLLLRIPEEVKAKDIETAKDTVRARKGIDTNVVKDAYLKEGRSIQVLHVGPYDEVGPVYERLMGHMTAQGLSCSGPPHEVYINDPRRVAPERIKTIVRIPIR